MNHLTDTSEIDQVDSGINAAAQLYTPAMMAEMLRVPVRAIRLWYRVGLLEPTRVIMKIPYFDYSVLATANTFAQWFHQGLSAQSIVKQLMALSQLSEVSEARINSLPIALDGKRLVLTQGSLQVEASGQIQFGFESEGSEEDGEPVTVRFMTGTKPERCANAGDSLAAMLESAMQAEDDEDLETAAGRYRSVLATFGPDADVCFQLAEVLYRQADLGAARERYFMAIELEPTMVEARANLGCVLAECGQLNSAVKVFEEALQHYPDYADVHFHLARALDDLGCGESAMVHWLKFIQLAPASPWADEAAVRLSQQPSLALE